MNKETKKKLLAPFPAEVVQDPPKGKFGKFVNHAVYVERLRDCDVEYEWEFEPIIINDKVIGAIGKLTIDGKVYQGAGDVEAPALARATTGECLKLAESDAFKRASMRAGLGVELWSGTDDFYMEDTSQPIQKTGRVKDIVIEKEEQESLNKAKQDFVSDIESKPNNKQDLAKFMESTVKDEAKREQIKKDIYNDVVSKGFPKDVNAWNSSQLDIFKDEVFNVNESKKTDLEVVEEVFGEVVDKTSDLKICPNTKKVCNDMQDMRQKKAEAPDGSKIKNLPDFLCQKNDKYNPEAKGCGWGGYIGSSGDKAVPTEWL